MRVKERALCSLLQQAFFAVVILMTKFYFSELVKFPVKRVDFIYSVFILHPTMLVFHHGYTRCVQKYF